MALSAFLMVTKFRADVDRLQIPMKTPDKVRLDVPSDIQKDSACLNHWKSGCFADVLWFDVWCLVDEIVISSLQCLEKRLSSPCFIACWLKGRYGVGRGPLNFSAFLAVGDAAIFST
jgi:hypothetical protein